MKKYLFPIIYMILPTLLFYVLYKAVGLVTSMVVSVVYNGVVLGVRYHTQKNIPNSQVIGLVGAAGSIAAIVVTANEKMYYIPALCGNVITSIFLLWIHARGKSVLHYLAKDFQIEALEVIPEQKMMPVNYLWISFFLLKMISKIFGIWLLEFEQLYWIVFLLGDPAMIAVGLLSVVIVWKQVHRKNNK